MCVDDAVSGVAGADIVGRVTVRTTCGTRWRGERDVDTSRGTSSYDRESVEFVRLSPLQSVSLGWCVCVHV